MDYLRIREQKLRDTNESTNTRVKWFGFMTTFLLIALWAWQIMYLRAYFRWVDRVPGAHFVWETDTLPGQSILFNETNGRVLGEGVLRALAWGCSQSRDAGEHGIMGDISGVLNSEYGLYTGRPKGNGNGLFVDSGSYGECLASRVLLIKTRIAFGAECRSLNFRPRHS